MRQFYDEPRIFRVTGAQGTSYESFDNSRIKQTTVDQLDGEELIREPVFDIEVIAERKNPFSVLSQNETIVNLFNMGMFNPENAQVAQIAIEMMEFEGKEKILSYIREGQTLLNVVKEQQAQIQQMSQMLNTMQQSGVGLPISSGGEGSTYAGN